MKNLIFLGAGVMASSISIPATDNDHNVYLVGSPKDDSIIEKLKAGKPHPKLDSSFTGKLIPLYEKELTPDLLKKADMVLMGVNCAGVNWFIDCLLRHGVCPKILTLITKGLIESEEGTLLTIPQYISEKLKPLGNFDIVGIGGPCIARELANRVPTLTIFAGENLKAVKFVSTIFEQDYYQIRTDNDLTGVETNAALKNFMTIGITPTWNLFPEKRPNLEKPKNMNPTAASFSQALREMAILTEWLGGNPEHSYQLAGAGDLFVTVNAGRNSRLGLLLGEGVSMDDAMQDKLKGETIEGAIVAQNLFNPIHKAFKNGELKIMQIPLTLSILNAVVQKKPFSFNHQLFFLNELL